MFEAWSAKESVRDIYCWFGDELTATYWLDALIAGCKESAVKEVRGLSGLPRLWLIAIL